MNITVERLEQIEQERQEIMGQPQYQNWVKELNVSQSYIDPAGVIAAREMNKEYDFKKLNLYLNLKKLSLYFNN